MNIVFLYSNKFDKRKTFSWVNKESKVAAVVSSNVPLKLLDSSPSEQLLPSFSIVSRAFFVFNCQNSSQYGRLLWNPRFPVLVETKHDKHRHYTYCVFFQIQNFHSFREWGAGKDGCEPEAELAMSRLRRSQRPPRPPLLIPRWYKKIKKHIKSNIDLPSSYQGDIKNEKKNIYKT